MPLVRRIGNRVLTVALNLEMFLGLGLAMLLGTLFFISRDLWGFFVATVLAVSAMAPARASAHADADVIAVAAEEPLARAARHLVAGDPLAALAKATTRAGRAGSRSSC